jgi:hypothetical protein
MNYELKQRTVDPIQSLGQFMPTPGRFRTTARSPSAAFARSRIGPDAIGRPPSFFPIHNS